MLTTPTEASNCFSFKFKLLTSIAVDQNIEIYSGYKTGAKKIGFKMCQGVYNTEEIEGISHFESYCKPANKLQNVHKETFYSTPVWAGKLNDRQRKKSHFERSSAVLYLMENLKVPDGKAGHSEHLELISKETKDIL